MSTAFLDNGVLQSMFDTGNAIAVAFGLLLWVIGVISVCRLGLRVLLAQNARARQMPQAGAEGPQAMALFEESTLRRAM